MARKAKKGSETMSGCIAPNLHEGTRSEYLAQYFFSSLGTAVPVPHPEDTGLDLHCTITDIIGKRAWPRCFYSVQIKSEWKEWSINGDESVKWLVNQPSPIFLCFVEKKSGRFRIYQTLARHSVSSQPPLPNRIELIPEDRLDGQLLTWKRGADSLSLSAPILDFTIESLLDESFVDGAKAIIAEWVRWDVENIHSKDSGILMANMPLKYKTNHLPPGSGRQGVGTFAYDERMLPAIENLRRSLDWLAVCMWRSGNQGLAVRMGLLLRRLYGDGGDVFLLLFYKELCTHFGLADPVHINEFTAGLDRIDQAIEDLLPKEWRGKPLPLVSEAMAHRKKRERFA